MEPFRALVERFAPTAPDFFVADVRLVAAAARAGDLAVLRDLAALRGLAALRDLDAALLEAALLDDALLDAALLAAPRAEVFAPERAAVFMPPRAAVEREVALFVDFADDLAAALAGAFLAVEREVVAFAAVFLALAFAGVRDADRAEVLAVDFAADFLAVLRDVVFAADLLPAFDAALREAVFVALFAALLRDEVPVDFAADLRAVEVPDFLAPDAALVLLVEPRRALLFLVLDLVLVAPESPVNSMVSGLDLSSVGIAASFKGLRVQPSRFEGNVVIPSGFRLTESVESKTGTFSVDTFLPPTHSDLRAKGRVTPAMRSAAQGTLTESHMRKGRMAS